MKVEWKYILNLINNNKIEEIVKLCKELKENEYNNIKNNLINEIKSTKNPKHRNTISIVLGDLGCNEAVPTLISLINLPQNWKCNATLIYALEELDCQKEITELIHILFDGNFEAKWNMYTLIKEKKDSLSENDRKKCVELIEEEIDKLEENLYLLKCAKEEIDTNPIVRESGSSHALYKEMK